MNRPFCLASVDAGPPIPESEAAAGSTSTWSASGLENNGSRNSWIRRMFSALPRYVPPDPAAEHPVFFGVEERPSVHGQAEGVPVEKAFEGRVVEVPDDARGHEPDPVAAAVDVLLDPEDAVIRERFHFLPGVEADRSMSAYSREVRALMNPTFQPPILPELGRSENGRAVGEGTHILLRKDIPAAPGRSAAVEKLRVGPVDVGVEINPAPGRSR